MNAEISLGTVTTVSDAVRWIGYTYLFVRMQRNPLAYGYYKASLLSYKLLMISFFLGMGYSEAGDDPALSAKRRQLVVDAAKELVKARMIVFNESNESFSITEKGQIAARYYIRHQSIEIFNKEMRPVMTEADILRLISKSTEVRFSDMRCSLFDLSPVWTTTTPRK